MQVVVALRTQYRMAEDIQLLANTLVYNGRLRCGTEAISKQVLGTSPAQPGLLSEWLLKVKRFCLECGFCEISKGC